MLRAARRVADAFNGFAVVDPVPTAGEVQGPIQLRTVVDQHIDHGRVDPVRWLGGPLDQRVALPRQIDQLRIASHRSPQGLGIARQEGIECGLDAVIACLLTHGPPEPPRSTTRPEYRDRDERSRRSRARQPLGNARLRPRGEDRPTWATVNAQLCAGRDDIDDLDCGELVSPLGLDAIDSGRLQESDGGRTHSARDTRHRCTPPGT